MAHRSPLPNVLVTIGAIYIVDVTGIQDPRLLWQALLATLWEHEYRRGDLDIQLYSDPVPGSSANIRLNSENLFNLCHNCAGSLKLILYPNLTPFGLVGYTPQVYSELPPWHGLPDIVVTVFSSYERKFICTVHLAGTDSVEIILDRIVKELQCHHHYIPGFFTMVTSEHQPQYRSLWGPAEKFHEHFKQDIGPDGCLKLFVDAYQARAANRTQAIQQQLSIKDHNFAGQALPCIVVTIVARRHPVCTIVLTGINDPQSIRQRIIDALRFYGYLIRPDVVITQTDCSAEMTYEPLTHHGLFFLCRDKGDQNGSLELFVEASTVVCAHEFYYYDRNNPLPKIIVSVLDWYTQQPYFHMDMGGLKFYEVYRRLYHELKARTNMKLVRIYGPQPDSWFSWESDGLYRLILEKGASNGSLTIFVVLKQNPDLSQEQCQVSTLVERPRSPGHVPSPSTHRFSPLNLLGSWLTELFGI